MAVPGAIIPAQLGFLAIYNPSLGKDETIDDQIVYYSSVRSKTQKRRHRSRAKPTANLSQEERNERLRQIGLAQAMVEFSKSFSGGKPVDTIDTEKSRVLLHELEPGWWILASIDLTRLPLPPKLPLSKSPDPADENVEYSSRELKPASLLLQDLLRAHSVFLLHHDTSLGALFARSRRSRFVSLLSRYWDLFLSTWNVMLQGNPIRNAFGGINMAASGELGIGVGEEDRGSGEREVLEGLVGRIEGLVDLVVSRFGSHDDGAGAKGRLERTLFATDSASESWLGTGKEPDAEDGAIFLGVGALSRKSLRDITSWMEDLYSWGGNAYGIIESPASARQGRRHKKPPAASMATDPPDPKKVDGSSSQSKEPAGKLPENAQPVAGISGSPPNRTNPGNAVPEPAKDDSEGGIDKIVNYLKLGYGTYWTLGRSGGGLEETSEPTGHKAAKHREDEETRRASQSKLDSASGYYLIGLMGEVEETSGSDHDGSRDSDEPGETEHNERTMLRTVHVELEGEGQNRPEAETVPHLDSPDRNKAEKLRVVVYVNKPFIFTFLFQLKTDSLAWDALYRSLHYQLAPLRRPLLVSTAYRPDRPDVGAARANIYDLIWDHTALTVHTTIPNIPDPGQAQGRAQVWSRVEATNTHLHLLNVFGATRAGVSELERTSKTNRGWWIVWTRILDRAAAPPGPSSSTDDAGSEDPEGSLATIPESEESEESEASGDSGSARPRHPRPEPVVTKEIFLLRRASDHAGFRAVSGSYAESGSGWVDNPAKLAQGIGVDTRKYIEDLLNSGR